MLARLTIGDGIPKTVKPKQVNAFSARLFPAITFGDWEKNEDIKAYWISYIQERFKVTFIQGTRYYMIFRRTNRFTKNFMHIVVLAGRTEIYACRNMYEIKAVISAGHLGRNRAAMRNNPQAISKSLTYTFYFRNEKKTYKVNHKKLGNMPNDFIIWKGK